MGEGNLVHFKLMKLIHSIYQLEMTENTFSLKIKSFDESPTEKCYKWAVPNDKRYACFDGKCKNTEAPSMPLLAALRQQRQC